MKNQAPIRIAAIDIFRAGTMFLMIFVNDLWTLEGVPEWLEHARVGQDRMGLADWVFPGFLFIAGLSIPFAVDARKKKNESKSVTFFHILKRSLSLIIMGFFMVNLETINSELLPISKPIWQLLMATAIVMIWNDYPERKLFRAIPVWVLQITGLAILGWIAFIYTGGSTSSPSWMKPQWWGILGIIGWAYLLVASLYLLLEKKALLFIVVVLAFYILHALEFLVPIRELQIVKFLPGIYSYAIIATGVLAGIAYSKLAQAGKEDKFMLFIILGALTLMTYGYFTRPIWEISKISGTPSWMSLCTGISLAAFGVIYIIADQYKMTRWAGVLNPAGRSTLTCYLVPYFYYAIMTMVGIYLPLSLRTGYVGVGKSLLFAALIVAITGILEKAYIRLKV